MRFVLLGLLVCSSLALADDPLTRAEAARATAKKRGAIPVPEVEADPKCFVPKFLEGQKCAEGLKLCVDAEGNGSCDGYGRETRTLRVEYEGEPPARSVGMNGARAGMPYLHEAGFSEQLEVDSTCRGAAFGFGVATRPGATPEEQAVERARAEADAKKAALTEQERCAKQVRARIAKERRWQRCELLAVDACRREAFLQCTGNELQRGLIRASWQRPKDGPASETMKVQVLAK